MDIIRSNSKLISNKSTKSTRKIELIRRSEYYDISCVVVFYLQTTSPSALLFMREAFSFHNFAFVHSSAKNGHCYYEIFKNDLILYHH